MSTKIYNGYRLKKTPKNLKEIRDILFRFKEKALEHYRGKYYKLLARDLTLIYDDACVKNKVDYKFPHCCDDKITYNITGKISSKHLGYAVVSAIERKAEIFRKQRSRIHDYEEYEFYCHIVILPYNNKVFLMTFTEEREVEDIFKNTEEIEGYPYWDNTDPPDGISYKRWEKRGEEWDEAFGNDNFAPPSKAGFGIDIVNGILDLKRYKDGKEYPDPIKESLKYIPDFKNRVYRLTRNLMYTEWVNKKEIKEELEKRNFFKTIKKFDKFIEDNENIVNEKKEEVSKLIIPELKIEDLTIEIKDFCEKYNLKEEEEENGKENKTT